MDVWRRRRCGLVSSIWTTGILSHVFISGGNRKKRRRSFQEPRRTPSFCSASLHRERFCPGSMAQLRVPPPLQRLSVLPRLHPFAADMATARRRPATQCCLLIGAEETAAPRLQDDHCSLSSAQRSSCPDRACTRARTRLLPRLQQNRAIIKSSDLNLRLTVLGPFSGPTK